MQIWDGLATSNIQPIDNTTPLPLFSNGTGQQILIGNTPTSLVIASLVTLSKSIPFLITDSITPNTVQLITFRGTLRAALLIYTRLLHFQLCIQNWVLTLIENAGQDQIWIRHILEYGGSCDYALISNRVQHSSLFYKWYLSPFHYEFSKWSSTHSRQRHES